MDHMGLRINRFNAMPHWKDALKSFLKQNNGQEQENKNK